MKILHEKKVIMICFLIFYIGFQKGIVTFFFCKEIYVYFATCFVRAMCYHRPFFVNMVTNVITYLIKPINPQIKYRTFVILSIQTNTKRSYEALECMAIFFFSFLTIDGHTVETKGFTSVD